MIKSIKCRKLRRFYEEDDSTGIQQKHIQRIRDILSALSTAVSIDDMHVPGWYLHPLQGKKPKRWSVRVDENWRITFQFENGIANLVDYEDYH